MLHYRRLVVALALVLTPVIAPIRAADPVKPRIRAITGFVTLDPKTYESQLRDTVAFLGGVRDAVKAAGYEVAGVRVSTQPFPDLTRGLSRADALALLRTINDLAGTL